MIPISKFSSSNSTWLPSKKKGTSAERLFAFPMFQDKNQCQNITLQKKGTSAERLFAFPSFQDISTDFLIFKSKTHVFQPEKKGLVLSDFLSFQNFKIWVGFNFPIFQVQKSTPIKMSSGSGNRPRTTASSNAGKKRVL